ncbi:MAG TPA: hypothetical protein ENK18_01845 [Deltaproteobacteria bacterium]|nr:hypothetical protein [Deltaproteobacteria bacterium]
MNRWSLLLFAIPLAGCVDFTPFQGVWWVELSPQDPLECTTEISHNFDVGEVPEEAEPEGYIVTSEGEGSPTGFYALITRGKSGRNYVNWGGEVYTGGVTGGILTVSWEDTWNGTVTGEYDGEYEYTDVEDSNETDTLVFSRNPEIGGMSGTSTTTLTSVRTFTEDDEWDAQDIGVLPQIPSAFYLVHEDGPPNQVLNSPLADDCDGGNCEIEVTQDCTQSFTFQAFFAGSGDDSLFEAIENYNQPPGQP